MSIQPRESETHDHMVQWVHDMYTRGRDPLRSLRSQARAMNRNWFNMTRDVLIACRPGGHNEYVEVSKSKYRNQYLGVNK